MCLLPTAWKPHGRPWDHQDSGWITGSAEAWAGGRGTTGLGGRERGILGWGCLWGHILSWGYLWGQALGWGCLWGQGLTGAIMGSCSWECCLQAGCRTISIRKENLPAARAAGLIGLRGHGRRSERGLRVVEELCLKSHTSKGAAKYEGLQRDSPSKYLTKPSTSFQNWQKQLQSWYPKGVEQCQSSHPDQTCREGVGKLLRQHELG